MEGAVYAVIKKVLGSHSNPETRLPLYDDILRETFSAIDVLDPNKIAITYYGGGISVTWNALF